MTIKTWSERMAQYDDGTIVTNAAIKHEMQAEIDELRAELAKQDAEIAVQEEEIVALRDSGSALKAEVERLRELLEQVVKDHDDGFGAEVSVIRKALEQK